VPTAAAGRSIPPGSELATRLESVFRLLGKRIYLPSLRQVRVNDRGMDRVSIALLVALEETDELRPSDVAAAVQLDLSTVSRQLRQLESLKLVTRRPDAVDRRSWRVSLTAAGLESLVRVRANRASMLEDVFRDWPEGEREQLLRLLDRLLVGLNTMSERPPSAHPTHAGASE
jgi:DNA-binding MarR family transcriptional regulator